MSARLAVSEVARRADQALTEIERAVVGKRPVLELVLIALLADGHVLLEDLPGVAKTLIARSFARVSGLQFGRIQFTPDLMPSDITGSSVFDQAKQEFRFVPGPVFTNLLLGDEINRASPKTQAALLEAMQERQVTIDGRAHRLEPPFLVIATQNPIEFEGTYPLPEAQVDRFMVRLTVGYPDAAAEWTVLSDRLERKTTDVDLHQVLEPGELLAMQRTIEDIYLAPSLGHYIVAVTAATRDHAGIEVGASPRGSLAVTLAARARAALDGRTFAVPEDVKAVALPALSHRLRLSPERWVRGDRPESLIAECLANVPTPSAADIAPP